MTDPTPTRQAALKVERMDGQWLVQGTRNVDDAITALMLEVEFRQYMDDCDLSSADTEERLRDAAFPDHYRKVGRLPGSLADAEGYRWMLYPSGPGRGAFPGVVFEL